jgi:sugar transferase EpsL
MKRLLDIAGSTCGLIVLSPIIMTACILVRIKLGSPILFRQERPGLNGTPFRMAKFRTMTDEKDTCGKFLSDEIRLTQFGRWLRSTSLDELPELWNVLRGDMSLVGPRPLLMTYLDRYTPEQARRHNVRPGLTGWAQVNGRNATSWDERLKMDTWYVDNRNTLLDLRIVGKTILTVVRRDGISHTEHATMPEFGIDEKTD